MDNKLTTESRTKQYLNMITDKNGELWISAHKLEIMLNNIQKEAITEISEKLAVAVKAMYKIQTNLSADISVGGVQAENIAKEALSKIKDTK